MDHQQLKNFYCKEKVKPIIVSRDILYELGGCDTTLLYGYTLERSTFHVYFKDMKIHKIIYNSNDRYPEHYSVAKSFDAEDLIPSKRAYPCRTLYTFSSLVDSLLGRDAISFTTFAIKDEAEFLTENNLYFAGKIKEDFPE